MRTAFSRDHKLVEKTLNEGDLVAVIGEVRRTADGRVEIHPGKRGLLLANDKEEAASLGDGGDQYKAALIPEQEAGRAVSITEL